MVDAINFNNVTNIYNCNFFFIVVNMSYILKINKWKNWARKEVETFSTPSQKK